MNVKDGHGVWTYNMDMQKIYAMWTWRMDGTSVSDPDLVASAFNLGLDPESGSATGIRIQKSKNRF
jgi:outer membrane lipoprotein-sorting protein